MDQFAKGINTMVPHAVWYDPATIVFKPDLSPGAPKYGPELPAYNQYIGRLQRLLQGGRHVADIGVLYPIATLQAGSWFGPGNPYEGCVDVPEADYMQVGEALSLGVRRDFTFVHPEVLEERCAVDGAAITLNNKVNHERWRAFIIPGSRCINVATLRRIKQFYDQGGTVIATTRLPDRAAEFGADAEVRQLVAEIFGPDVPRQDDAPRVSASSTWAGGYDPVKTMDGSTQTRWNAADGDKGAQWLEADLGNTQTVAGVVVNEVFDRVRGYRIQTWDGTAWVDQAKGDRLGERKEITFAPWPPPRFACSWRRSSATAHPSRNGPYVVPTGATSSSARPRRATAMPRAARPGSCHRPAWRRSKPSSPRRCRMAMW